MSFYGIYLPNAVNGLILMFKRINSGEKLLEMADEDAKTAKVRCPICRWRPRRNSRWTCWDCDHPEYFRGGCGTEWNTFETKGMCPTCSHQWTWTSCLSCWGWSKHDDWYE